VWPIWRENRYGSAERCSMRIGAWLLCSPASEVASWWRNAIGSGRKLWLLAEPVDDGRRARCSHAPCQRCPLERLTSLIRLASSVARKSGKLLAEALGWSLGKR
jgi:hypothetical protein